MMKSINRCSTVRIADAGLSARLSSALLGSVAILALVAPAAARAQASAGPAVAAEATPAASADEGIADIVVTAQKREQRLQDVPVAITALSEDALVGNRIATVRDLDAVVPNLTVRNQVGGSALPLYSLRGVVGLGSTQGTDKGIAVYIDGVYLGTASGSILSLAEIERIEVLRGPQGTLFGRNSTGGAISFVTPEPKGEFGAKQWFTVGNYDQLRSSTRIDSPQVGPFSARVVYTHSERRGDIRNLGAGTVWDFTRSNGGKQTLLKSPKWLGSDNTESVAAALKFEPSDSLKAIYRFDYTTSDYTSAGLGSLYLQPIVRSIYALQPNQSILTPVTRKRPDAVNARAAVPSHLMSYGHALTVDYKATDNLSFKNIMAYRKASYRAPWAEVSSAGGLLNTGGAIYAAVLGPAVAAATVGAPLQILATSTAGHDKQFSNEFQAILDTDFATLTVGALYYNQTQAKGAFGEESGLGRGRSGSFLVYPSFAVPYAGQPQGTMGRITSVKVRSYAGYAYGEFHVTPKIDLVGGIRYTDDKKSGIDYSLVSGRSSLTFPIAYQDDQITFNVGSNYKISSDILVYAKYSTGYISGGSLSSLIYKSETAKSWEAGIKADWFDRILRTNLALFTVKYGNIQQATSGVALNPPRPEITNATINAGDARAKGFELETTLKPLGGITLSSGVGYTDFKYTSLSPAVTSTNVKVLTQYRPDWTINLAGQYDSEPVYGDATLTARVDANWKSKDTGLSGVPTTVPVAERATYEAAGVIKPYWLVNSRVGLQGIDIGGAKGSVGLWVRNLLDEKKPQYVISFVLSIAADYERARTFGADFTLEF